MSAPSDTNLKLTGRLVVQSLYKKIDVDLNPNTLRDDIDFKDIRFEFNNGRGPQRVNLQFYERYTLNNGAKVYNLDGGLVNRWNDTLNYDSVKLIVIRNNSLIDSRKFIQVNFKNEQYYIGPTGSRVILEPAAEGISPLISSGSSEEGSLTVQTDEEVSYDLLIWGSDNVSSSSSG